MATPTLWAGAKKVLLTIAMQLEVWHGMLHDMIDSIQWWFGSVGETAVDMYITPVTNTDLDMYISYQ